jgi:hypothetical protein
MDDCDTYIKVVLGGHQGQCSAKDGDDTPQWNAALFVATATELTTMPMGIQVMDDDSVFYASDDRIGECLVQVTQANLNAGVLVIPSCGKAQNLILKFAAK